MKKDKFLLCGGCFAGNMGGDAMYETFIHQVKEINPDNKISVLTKYPKDEVKICRERGYKVFKFTTIDRVLLGIPFFIIGSFLKFFHLPHKWLAVGSLKQYYENDLLVDFSGISFSDFRGFLDLIINVTWFLPAYVSGIPIIKMSQSLGTYQKLSVRFCAKYCLKRIHIIVARGDKSYNATKELLPMKKLIYNLPDVAICLPAASLDIKESILKSVGLENKKYVVLSPSIVVDERAGEKFYRGIIKKIIQEVHQLTGYPVLLVPHTRSISKAAGVDSASDDLTVCCDIENYFKNSDIPVKLLTKRYDAKELKSVIAGAEFIIGSRYHSLIASMSSGVPSLALGWGHKYYEMFELFGMEEFAFEYHDFDEERIVRKVKELAEQYREIRRLIEEKLPGIKKESSKNVQLALKLARKYK